jgi:DNA-binding transcriptional ArsR family regulator
MRGVIVKYMLQFSLDAVLHALADPTRRAIVERLVGGPASLSDLAAPFQFTLTAIGQHVHVLEESGVVTTRKEGRVRKVELRAAALSSAEHWFAQHRKRWEERLDRLGAVLFEDDDEADDGVTPSKARPVSNRRKKKS